MLTWLEFVLAYYYVTVQYVNHYAKDLIYIYIYNFPFSLIGPVFSSFPHRRSQCASIWFLISPIFMLARIPWRFHLPIFIAVIAVVLSVFSYTIRRLLQSICCLRALRRVRPCRTSAFWSQWSRPTLHSEFISLQMCSCYNTFCMDLCIACLNYIYIYIYMIKISGKVHKSNTYNRFSSNISFFILWRTSSD